MNVSEIINLMILIDVCIILIMIFQFFTFIVTGKSLLGFCFRLGGPVGFWIDLIWYIFFGLLACLFCILVTIKLGFYNLWKLIKRFAPNFPIPFKRILLRIPPFPQLEAARIFALFDGVFGTMYGRGPLSKRFVGLFNIIGDFVQHNMTTIAHKVEKKIGKHNFDNSKPEKDDKGDSAFSESEQRMINEQMQQCLHENLIPITKDMSASDNQTAQIQNNLVSVKCQMNQFKSYTNLLSFR